MNNQQTAIGFSRWMLLFLCTLATVASIANAQDAGSDPSTNSKVFKAGCEIDYPPFCAVDGHGTAVGFSVELMRAAFMAMGKNVAFQTGTWDEVKQSLVDGRIEALPLVGRTPERETTFDFTFPYLTMHGAIVVRKDSTGINDLNDLKGLRVAVMKGDNAEEFLRREERGLNIEAVVTFVDAFRLLSTGGCDAVVVQRLVGLRLIKETGLTNLRMVEKPIDEFRQDFCFAVREGDRDTLACLNEGLALVVADGTYQHLHSKWFAALELPAHGRIVIGGDRNYPPYEYLDKNGRPAGYNVELTRAIALALGMDVEIRLDDWTKIRKALENGEIDAVQGMFYSPQRDLKFDFTPPHAINPCVSVVRKGSGKPPDTVAELTGKDIVVQRGDIMHDFAVEHGLGDRVSAVDTEEDALRELSEGKHDCALVQRSTAMYWIKKRGWTNLVLGKTPLLSPEYCYAAPNGHGAILAQLSEGLRILDANGEYHRIQAKYLGIYRYSQPGPLTILRYVAMWVLPLLLTLVASLIWTWSLRKQVAVRTAEMRREVGERQRAEEQVRKLLEESESARGALLSILEDRQKAEDHLKENTLFLHTLLDAIPVPVFYKDAEGRYLGFNKAFETFFGKSTKALIGKNVFEIGPAELAKIYHAKDLELFQNPGMQVYDSKMKDAKGRMHDAVYHKATFTDRDGKVAGLIGAILDITDIRARDASLREANRQLEAALMEVRKSQAQVIQQARLGALGQMASGIAHDFNNLLVPLLGFSELMLNDPSIMQNKEESRELLTAMHTAARDARSLIRRLREFYHPDDALETDEVSLKKLIEESISLTEPRWKQQAQAAGAMVTINRDYGDIPFVACNRTQIREVLTNMILNAVDAMPKGGAIDIRTRADGEGAVVTVHDNGIGMSEETRQRCFDPYYTTKGPKGTGMGLAMAYGVISRHGGSIGVESEVGKGTTLTIRLPLKAPGSVMPSAIVLPEKAKRQLRILAVDDEEWVRSLIGRYLKADGHTVTTAINGTEGIHKFAEGEFDLVITDRAMPDISGDELAKAIKKQSPKTPVLLLTGFGELMKDGGEQPEGVDVILSKPMTRDELRLAIEDVVAQDLSRG